MSANENKKPIGFDMELTEEQLKDAAGGIDKIIVPYRCTVCGVYVSLPYPVGATPWPTMRSKHRTPRGQLCDFPVELV